MTYVGIIIVLRKILQIMEKIEKFFTSLKSFGTTDNEKMFIWIYAAAGFLIFWPMMYRWTRRLFSRNYAPVYNINDFYGYRDIYLLVVTFFGVFISIHSPNVRSFPIFFVTMLFLSWKLFSKLEKKSHYW